jgi:hypothetical protein
MHRFLLTLIISFFLLVSLDSSAQTVDFEIDVTEVNWGISGDCYSGPDPRIYVELSYDGVRRSGQWRYERDDQADGSVWRNNFTTNPGTYTGSIVLASANATAFLYAFEDDDAACDNLPCVACSNGGPDDATCGYGGTNYCNGTAGTPGYNSGVQWKQIGGPTFMPSQDFCAWSTTQEGTRTCSEDASGCLQWGARWRWRWSYAAGSIAAATTAGVVALSVAGDATMCDGGNPSVINNSTNGTIYPRGTVLWQQNVNGAGWTDIAGTSVTNATASNATANQTYDPPALAISGGATTTYQFRRAVRYCTSYSAGTTTDYGSNVITITVVPDPNAPSATKNPNTTDVCLGTNISLVSPVKGSLPGAACSGFEYNINGGGWGATANLTTVALGTNTIDIRVAGGCANGCNVSAPTSYSWNVVAQPTSPTTATAIPVTSNNQCAGTTLTLDVAGATGGAAGLSCSIQYQYSLDGGLTWSGISTTIPSFSAVYPAGPTKTNIIQARRNSCQTGCTGPTAWATVATWTIVPDPSAPTTATASPSTAANQCEGTTLTLSAGASGGTNAGVGCTIRYQYSTDGGTTWIGPSATIPSFAAVYPAGATKTNIIQANRSSCQTGCDDSPWATMATWTIVQDPTSPTTATLNPNVASVCDGTTLSLAGAATGGNAGVSCSIEYRFSTDGGSSWSSASTSIPSFSAVGTSSNDNIIEVRRNSCQSGCDQPTAWNEIARWSTVPDPDAPNTSTPSPSDATVCAGTTLTLSGVASGGNPGLGCSIEYQYSTDNGSSWTNTATSVPSFAAVSGANNIIQARRSGCQAGCNTSSWFTAGTWVVVAQPVAGTLAKTPNSAAVCEGDNVSAALTAGTGGAGTVVDELDYRTDDGTGFTAWAPYTSTTNIPTTGLITIEIRTYRTSSVAGCTTSSTNTVSWTVLPQPVSGTLSKTPNVTNVCEGTSVSAALTAGSGGAGTVTDVLEYRFNGTGGWSSYTSGASLSTTGRTLVEVRTYRTATGPNCVTGTINTVSWVVDVAPVATPTSQLYTCDGTANLLATGISGGTTIAWEYVSGPVSPTGTTTSNPVLVTFSTPGTGVYNLLGSNTGCSNINLGTVNLVMPTTSTTNIATTASCGYCVVNDANTKIFYNGSGDIIAKIEDDPLTSPQKLDETEVCVRMDGSVQFVTDNIGYQQPYLPRQWTIHPSDNGAQNTTVTLYFTNAELTALQSAAFGGEYQFSGYYSLSMTKYPGGQNGSFTAPASLNGTHVDAAFSSYGSNHKAVFEVNSFSTFYIHPTLFPFAALPVELVSFTGWNQGSVNRLQWITASELNTSKYVIEKSTSPRNWEVIGEKSAAGNSNQRLTYDFTDNNPVIGNNYYRLKVIDNDGTFSYSNTINVPLAEAVSNNFVNVYPNPTGGQLNVEIQSTGLYDTKVSVFDVIGKKVFEKQTAVVKGLNTLQFDFSQFTKGTYVIQFADKDGKLHTTKFVKD